MRPAATAEWAAAEDSYAAGGRHQVSEAPRAHCRSSCVVAGRLDSLPVAEADDGGSRSGATAWRAEEAHLMRGPSSWVGDGPRRVLASQSRGREAGRRGRLHAPARREGDGAAAVAAAAAGEGGSGRALEHRRPGHDDAAPAPDDLATASTGEQASAVRSDVRLDVEDSDGMTAAAAADDGCR